MTSMTSYKSSNSGAGGRNSGFSGFRFTKNEEDLLEEVTEDEPQQPRPEKEGSHPTLIRTSSDASDMSRVKASNSSHPLQDSRLSSGDIELSMTSHKSSQSSLDSASGFAPSTLQLPSSSISTTTTSSPKISNKMREHFAAIKSKIKSLDEPVPLEHDVSPTHEASPMVSPVVSSGIPIVPHEKGDKSTSDKPTTPGISSSPSTDKLGSFYRDIKTKVHEVQRKFEQKRAENRRRSGSSISTSTSNSTLNAALLQEDDPPTSNSHSVMSSLMGRSDEKPPQEMISITTPDKQGRDEQDLASIQRFTPESEIRYTPSMHQSDLLIIEAEEAEDVAKTLTSNESMEPPIEDGDDLPREPEPTDDFSFLAEYPLILALFNALRNANISRAVTIAILSISVALVSPLPNFLNGLILGILLTIIGLTWILVAFIDNYFTKIQQTYDEKNIPLRMETIDAVQEYRPSSSLQFGTGQTDTISSSRDSIASLSLATPASLSLSKEVFSEWMHEFIGDYETRIADSEEDLLGQTGQDMTTLEIKQEAKEIIIKPTKASKKDSDSKDEEKGNHSKKKTQLVYVRLDGSMLRISKPKKSFRKLKEKDRTSSTLPHFVGQRVFDLSKKNTKVYLLLPKCIRARKKYLWLKKYPICIEQDNCKSYLDEDSEQPTNKITLFVHNCRDKEVWFWRFLQATKQSFIHRSLKLDYGIISPETPSSYGSTNTLVPHHFTINNSKMDHSQSVDDFYLPRTSSVDSSNVYEFPSASSRSIPATPTNPSIPAVIVDKTSVRGVPFLYDTFMAKIVYNATLNTTQYPNVSHPESSSAFPDSSMAWFNSFMGRIFFDILSHPFWQRWIANKIQRKLARLKMPHFMPALAVTDISLGSNIPIFKGIKSQPKLDSRGLWVDLDISYSGGFMMTLETKVDLIKFKQQGSGLHEMKPMHSSSANTSQSGTPSATPTPGSSNYPQTPANGSGNGFDGEFSESDDSDFLSESSEEESEEQASGIELEDAAEKTKQKVLKILDKVAASPLFQQVTDTKYVREVMEKVSNCPLILTVQIQALDGVLTVNIPPPPTDRLWYAFREKPNLVLSARPKFGDHHVSWTHMLEFIEKKLKEEFHDTLVMPNMDDLIIPALITTADQFIKVVP